MTIRFRGRDDVELFADVDGPVGGVPILLLHGGGQTRHAWKGTVTTLARRGFLAAALDLRGHGQSGWAPDGDYGIDAYAADVRAVAASFGDDRGVALVGASLGGLASLIAAGEAPAVPCRALVLVDITPQMDEEGKDRISGFMRSHPQGFASIEEAADAVAAYLPHRPRPADPSGLAKNLRLGEDGRYHWHWDPAFMDQGRTRQDSMREERFEAAAAAVRCPMLLVRGAMSEIVTEAGVAAFRAVAPAAEYVDVADASHMVAGDRNDVFTAGVIEFLERVAR